MTPDYRGGLNFGKGFGSLLGSGHVGLFYETTADAIYVSRFDKDKLLFSQHRAGYTFHTWDNTTAQLLWNANYARDLKGEYWANTFETGPGVKVRLHWMPRNVYWTTDFLRGYYLAGPYLDNQYSRHSNYTDIRVGFWYAMTK
jgi:hypothetical protein